MLSLSSPFRLLDKTLRERQAAQIRAFRRLSIMERLQMVDSWNQMVVQLNPKILKKRKKREGQRAWFSNQKGLELLDVFLWKPELFQPLRKKVKVYRVEKVKIPVARLEDILQMKKESNRPQDQADIALIKTVLRK